MRQNAVSFFGAAHRISQGHNGADGDLGLVGVFKVGAPSAKEVAFGLRAAAHEDALLFLGGLKLKVLTEISVGTSRGDVLCVLRDLSV